MLNLIAKEPSLCNQNRFNLLCICLLRFIFVCFETSYPHRGSGGMIWNELCIWGCRAHFSVCLEVICFYANRPWHFLYFLPLPHGHGSFGITFGPTLMGWLMLVHWLWQLPRGHRRRVLRSSVAVGAHGWEHARLRDARYRGRMLVRGFDRGTG